MEAVQSEMSDLKVLPKISVYKQKWLIDENSLKTVSRDHNSSFDM